VCIFLGSGGEGEAARDGWLPYGQEIFGALDPRTGSQEILHIRKMGTLTVRNGGKAAHARQQVCNEG
jgi:hypothetical protein